MESTKDKEKLVKKLRDEADKLRGEKKYVEAAHLY